MAAVFQFHRINQHPLHFSYITFAIITMIMLPPPNSKSDYKGKLCYDLGASTDDAEFAETWDLWGSEDNSSDTSNEGGFLFRYV